MTDIAEPNTAAPANVTESAADSLPSLVGGTPAGDHSSRDSSCRFGTVANPARLTREPQPLLWEASGEPVGASLQLVPPYERRVATTERGEIVTGIRVLCALDNNDPHDQGDQPVQRVHVDLAAAHSRMASVWDATALHPVALLTFSEPAGSEATDAALAEAGVDATHQGAVQITTTPMAYLRGRDTTTERFPNLPTALAYLATREP